MNEQTSIISTIAERYAKAVFDIAHENGAINALESDVTTLKNAVADSADLRDLLHSPLYTRTQTEAAIGNIATAMQLRPTMVNALCLMGRKGRLFVVPALLTALQARIATHKGEVPAHVTTATPLDQAQSERLAATLRAALGKDVTLNVTVDRSLIGGLVVKVGSKMIDTSIRSRLNVLQATLQEAR